MLIRLICYLGIHWKDPTWIGCEELGYLNWVRTRRCKHCDVHWRSNS